MHASTISDVPFFFRAQHESFWPNDPTISGPMSEDLFYATIWFIYNGKPEVKTGWNYEVIGPETGKFIEHPLDAPDRETWHRFFATTFRPQWTPKDVDDFVKEG